LRSLVLRKRFGWDDRAEVLPRRWRWGHGGVDVFTISHGTVLGPSTHVFNDVEWGPDESSSGGGTFAEAVRCPFETFWRCGADGGVSVEEPSGESRSCLPVATTLVRCIAPQCGWWGALIGFFAIGGTLRAIPFHEVNEGGVGRDWYSQDWFVGRVASLVAFCLWISSQICLDGRSTVW
jgi:hypothetical protein